MGIFVYTVILSLKPRTSKEIRDNHKLNRPIKACGKMVRGSLSVVIHSKMQIPKNSYGYNSKQSAAVAASLCPNQKKPP